MKSTKSYFRFTLFLYFILVIWGIKGPSSNDVWQYNFIMQIIAFNIIGLIVYIKTKTVLKEDPNQKKIASRLLILFSILSVIIIFLVISM